MPEIANAQLAAWQSFYVIVGSSAGALVGLQFVVMTLIGEMRTRASAGTVGAFGTPTVVHLASALLVSALMSAPWVSLAPASLALAACGGAGLAYDTAVLRRARRQTDYTPVWEDWLWYVLLPYVAYATLAAAAIALPARTQAGLFGVAGATLALLVIGIHNAWDSVTHIVISARQDEKKTQ